MGFRKLSGARESLSVRRASWSSLTVSVSMLEVAMEGLRDLLSVIRKLHEAEKLKAHQSPQPSLPQAAEPTRQGTGIGAGQGAGGGEGREEGGAEEERAQADAAESGREVTMASDSGTGSGGGRGEGDAGRSAAELEEAQRSVQRVLGILEILTLELKHLATGWNVQSTPAAGAVSPETEDVEAYAEAAAKGGKVGRGSHEGGPLIEFLDLLIVVGFGGLGSSMVVLLISVVFILVK